MATDQAQQPKPERRRQNSITSRVRDTFQKINFDRVFHCVNCKKVWLGKDLYKNHDKQYVCLACAQAVIDVTDTPLGKSFLDIVMPNWKEQ